MVIINLFPDSTSHLTLTLTGLGKIPNNDGRFNLHISYFPGNEHSRAGFRTHFLIDDLKHSTSISVILPSIESCGIGLSEAAIFDWWKNEFIPNQEPFGWIGNNCSTIIYRALCIGQERSPLLGHAAQVPKSWFCTPSNVIMYADKLGARLIGTFCIDDILILRYIIIKEECKQISETPFLSTQSLYKKICDFNCDRYSLTLNKTFCDGIKLSLIHFREHLQQNFCPSFYDELIGLAYLDPDYAEINIDFYYKKIKCIANYFVSQVSAFIEECDKKGNVLNPTLMQIDHSLRHIEKTFESALKIGLQNTLKQFLENNQLHFLNSHERIAPVLEYLRNAVNDALNPHRLFHQTSENIRAIMPGAGLGMTRQI